MIKFGIQDDREGGLSLDEGLETARQMVEYSIDAIEVSAGVGQSAQATKEDEPERVCFRERAAATKRILTIPVMVVEGIRSLEMAQEILDSGDADLISMCRSFIREPGLVSRWQKGDLRPARCISCNRCFGVLANEEPLECGEERRLREEAAPGG
jgi:2,4-dienoyl-CoA reductase-like NADH-dependent reductase (Old Yellow Enzyme family)